MRFLVYGDLHLKPTAGDYDLDAMVVPENVDAALILGDLTHRADPDDIDLARRFVERIEQDSPVIYIPGNHDPAPMDEQVVDSMSNARSGHRTTHEFGDITVVGWGCEQRTLSPAIDQAEFDALDPRSVPRRDRRYATDRIAADLETACQGVISGRLSPAGAADSLGIEKSERAAFQRGIKEVEATYDLLAELLKDRENVLLATHLPPFNTSFDRHHAVGTRKEDRELFHDGSIALKLAIRDHDVFAALSGHSHTYDYDVGDKEGGRPHYLNLGYRGIGVVTIEPSQLRFEFTRATEEDW